MNPSMRCLAACILTAAALATGAANAQSNPSADQIIQSLRPGGGMRGGTRGIRPVAPSAAQAEPPPVAEPSGTSRPQAAASAPGRHASPAPAAPAAAAPSVNLTVQFASNSADLTPAAVRTLSELGRALASNTLATYRFRIEGHTDTAGAADMNRALSERRAMAVVAFLTSTFHIDAARLEPVGMGEDGLLVQTPANTPEPRNRRVQVINLGT